jgi:hypothetical protein
MRSRAEALSDRTIVSQKALGLPGGLEPWYAPFPLARKTNHLERFNNTLRQRVSRLVRNTLAFSKKLALHVGAIRSFICYYNLTRGAALHG